MFFTPGSYLSGSFPPELGNLAKLKCMYFSHNIISGTIPRTFEQLTKLQVFLMQHNHLSGPLIDFAPLTQLKNVYAQPALLTFCLLPSLAQLNPSHLALL